MVMAREVVVSRDCLILVSTTEDGLTSCQMVAYPTMIKVSCVGDGEGIRRVHNGEEAKVLFKKAQGEEPGSPIFILKVATQYRHLKVQQLCDKYENVAALHSRDFNVQRRHQKHGDWGISRSGTQSSSSSIHSSSYRKLMVFTIVRSA
ncbi:acetyl-CoA carboxylase 1-like isoform X2 [Physcomitrium patens]|uniref:acetyl-CoA carboxylase 1-like isoform X2 n=1 Tax=Physcomitrium patens TaxID=3218 RepID=UPI003CCD2665